MSFISFVKTEWVKEQGGRFVRLFAVTLIPQLVALNGHYGRDVLIATVVGTAEVVYRQIRPTKATQ